MIFRPIRSVFAMFLVVVFVQNLFAAEPDLERLRYSLSKTNSIRIPTFELDLSDSKDPDSSRKWGEGAVELCEEWFPVLCKFLDTDRFSPPEVVKIAVKKELQAPGVTVEGAIFVQEEWIQQHPDDFGMVIHELVHVIQHYPRSRNKPGWVVEGIADYLRYWKYESERPHGPVDARASYLDGYSTSASFLAWIVWKYDRRAVRKLDASLRKCEYKDSIFDEITGKNLPELWDEFIKHEQSKAK